MVTMSFHWNNHDKNNSFGSRTILKPDFDASLLNISTIKLDSALHLKMTIKGAQWVFKMGETILYRKGMVLSK